MKRLHIVGKSRDNKRLYLAKAKDAKYGSFEIPIGRKLLRLIEEVQAARRPRRAGPAPKVPPAQEPDLAGVRVISAEPFGAEERGQRSPEGPRGQAEAASSSLDPGSEQITFPWETESIDLPLPTGEGQPPAREPGPEARPSEGQGEIEGRPHPARALRPTAAREAAAAREATADREATASAPEKPAGRPPAPVTESEEPPSRRGAFHARATRVEIPERSNLTPAEIQALIRAGRGVRTVARLAGTPLAWIRYLAEPIRQERQGVVDQLLRSRQTRTRLGPSSETIGESVYQNLRSRGIRNPDRILEDGFTAQRSDERQWRVRLTFEHRGKRHTARWSFDPQTREVTPTNTLAGQLGWRRPRRPEEVEGEPVRRRRAAPRRGQARTPARKAPVAATRKRAAPRKKTAAARKQVARTSSTARKQVAGASSTSRKTVARRKTSAAARSAAKRKTSARR